MRHARGTEECPATILSFYWNQGMWSLYCGSVGWSLATMQGEFMAANIAETVLNIGMTGTGCVVLSFLVGDLCNAVSNMDPVRNDYILAFDSLNNYIDEIRPPPSLRHKLREYMSLSEVVFREDYHRNLLQRLSPGLLAIVAQHNLASVVVQLPFYVDTIKRAYNLAPGTYVAVRYPNDLEDFLGEEDFTKRWCTVVRQHRCMLLVDVVFDIFAPIEAETEGPNGDTLPSPLRSPSKSPRNDDDFATHQTIPMAWIDPHSYGTQASKNRMARTTYEENRFVVAVTRRLTTQLFMPRDQIIRNDLTPVDNMYVIHSGRALVFGRTNINILALEFKSVNDVVGDDICTLLVGDRSRRRRHYTVRSVTVLQVYVLPGAKFCEVIDEGVFDEFKVGVRRYGCFLRVQRALIVHARARVRGHKLPAGGSGEFSFADQAQMGGAGGAYQSSYATTASRRDGDDSDDDIDDDEVILNLVELDKHTRQLVSAPDKLKRRFARENADMTALAPMFADITRRINLTLESFAQPKLARAASTKSVVSSLEHENVARANKFRAARH